MANGTKGKRKNGNEYIANPTKMRGDRTMSIEEIKDINKLRQMLKIKIDDNKRLYNFCERAGLELEKHSVYWDGKAKYLVVQAEILNEKYEKLVKTLTEIKEIADNTRDLLYSSCDSIDEADDKLEQILQKCEVLDERKE